MSLGSSCPVISPLSGRPYYSFLLFLENKSPEQNAGNWLLFVTTSFLVNTDGFVSCLLDKILFWLEGDGVSWH